MERVRSAGNDEGLSIEVRAFGNGSEKEYFTGYALKFGVLSRPFSVGKRRLFERIERSALQNTDMSVMNGYYNHEYTHSTNLLASNRNGTLITEVDSVGLKYFIEVPKGANGEDLAEKVRSGLVSESSFGMMIDWGDKSMVDLVVEGDKVIRSIKDIPIVYDISLTPYARYADTSISMSKAVRDALGDEEIEENQEVIEEVPPVPTEAELSEEKRKMDLDWMDLNFGILN